MSTLFTDLLGPSVTGHIHEWSRPKRTCDYSDHVAVYDMKRLPYRRPPRGGLESSLPWSNVLLKNRQSTMYTFCLGSVSSSGDSRKEEMLVCLIDRDGRVHATAIASLTHCPCGMFIHPRCVGECIASSDLTRILPSFHHFSISSSDALNPHERTTWNTLERHIQSITRPIIHKYISGDITLHEATTQSNFWLYKMGQSAKSGEARTREESIA